MDRLRLSLLALFNGGGIVIRPFRFRVSKTSLHAPLNIGTKLLPIGNEISLAVASREH